MTDEKTSDLAKSGASIQFDRKMASGYDARNAALSAISDNMHFLVNLVLADLPARARVLCVGVGTGAELLSLARAYPDWTFVGIDPSADMLEVCRDKLEQAGISDRCELLQGYVQDAPAGDGFDAVVSMLVAHFISREDRPEFYREIHDRLLPGGCFVSAEICYDLEADGYPTMVTNWGRVQALMGATPESLEKLPEMLRKALGVLSPEVTDTLLREAGFALPVAFFQALMIRGVYAFK